MLKQNKLHIILFRKVRKLQKLGNQLKCKKKIIQNLQKKKQLICFKSRHCIKKSTRFLCLKTRAYNI